MGSGLAGEIARQKQRPGKPMIAYGGANFGRELIKQDLVDEYRLVVHPVLLGKGLAIFDGLEQQRALKLVSSTAFRAVVRTCARTDRRNSSGRSRAATYCASVIPCGASN